MARDSRSAARPGPDSRLGALGLGDDTRLSILADALSDFGASVQPAEPEEGRGEASPYASLQSITRARGLHSYAAARVVIGVALVLAQIVMWEQGARGSWWPLVWCGAYLLEGAGLWAGLRRLGSSRRLVRAKRWLWWGTVGADLLAFSALHWLAPAQSLSHAALLVLPALMSGVLGTRTSALATAAASALLLLVVAASKSTQAGDLASLLSQAGLVGLGLFMIALLSEELANRLARQEQSARQNLALALQQAELNRLVIDEMPVGVLVVDRRGQVRAANPAARDLLAESGHCPVPPFALKAQGGWSALQQAVEAGYEAGYWPSVGSDLTVAFGQEAPRSVRVRARFTRQARVAGGAGRDEVLAVLFMEELREVLARQRQERLVAMGRISAGIAHEIRNPLAAISQANALLQEDDLRADQQRLVRIVSDNVERLKRIVDDVMEAAPGAAVPSRTLDLCSELSAICSEWARTTGLALGPDSRLTVELPSEPVGAIFDPDHLRRVLVNLLENGLRHASGAAGAVQLSLAPVGESLVRLSVASDGEPIPLAVEAHLFEPFHSTRSRGTGLGLYICRELCERHGASIDYLRRPGERHGNVFQVVMRRDTIDSHGHLHL